MDKETSQPDLGADRDDETGRFTETYPPDEFIEAIRDEGGEAATRGVADTVGCSYETAYKKLQALSTTGAVDHRRVGNAYLWEIADE